MTNLFKCQVAGKQNRKTQFSKDFYFIGHHLFLFLRPFIALCRNWKLFHSLWMLFHKLLCWRLLMQCWTGRKAEDLWAAAFLQPFRAGERERIRRGESPQIWKDKWNLGEMFLGRCGGQMYGSSRKFKPKKGLLGKEGSQERQVHAGCRLWGALSHLSLHLLALMGTVMEWAWKRESSESLVFCLRLLRVQAFIHPHLSKAYWCVLFAVCSSEWLRELQNPFFLFLSCVVDSNTGLRQTENGEGSSS